jgi:hypothetical protein
MFFYMIFLPVVFLMKSSNLNRLGIAVCPFCPGPHQQILSSFFIRGISHARIFWQWNIKIISISHSG